MILEIVKEGYHQVVRTQEFYLEEMHEILPEEQAQACDEFKGVCSLWSSSSALSLFLSRLKRLLTKLCMQLTKDHTLLMTAFIDRSGSFDRDTFEFIFFEIESDLKTSDAVTEHMLQWAPGCKDLEKVRDLLRKESAIAKDRYAQLIGPIN